jgi:hypothetical protein
MSSLDPRYLSPAVRACYDGAANPGSPVPGGPAPTPNPGDARFTQDDLNRLLAEDRRKHEARYQVQLTRAQQAIEEASKNQNLTLQEREQLAQQLEDMRKETQTKEQQLAHDKEQYETKLKQEKKGRETAEALYKETTITRDLTEAAVAHDAYNVETLVAVLKPWSRVEEVKDAKGKGTGRFQTIVDFPTTDPETGEPIVISLPAKKAVKQMTEKPEKWGNLFRAGVAAGVASNSGIPTGTGGKIDFKSLTQEQYLKIRKENPALLGLRTQKGHRAM